MIKNNSEKKEKQPIFFKGYKWLMLLCIISGLSFGLIIADWSKLSERKEILTDNSLDIKVEHLDTPSIDIDENVNFDIYTYHVGELLQPPLSELMFFKQNAVVQYNENQQLVANELGTTYGKYSLNEDDNDSIIYVYNADGLCKNEIISKWDINVYATESECDHADITLTETTKEYLDFYYHIEKKTICCLKDNKTNKYMDINIIENIYYYIPTNLEIKLGEDVGANLDAELIESFYNDGYKCIIKPNIIYEKFSETDNEWTTLAYFNPRHKLVIMRRNFNTNDVISHEMGHYFEHKCEDNGLCDESDLIDLFNEESEDYHLYNENYARKNYAEFFAECFARYLLEPEKLQENCPKIYDYIDSRYNNLILD